MFRYTGGDVVYIIYDNEGSARTVLPKEMIDEELPVLRVMKNIGLEEQKFIASLDDHGKDVLRKLLSKAASDD